MNLASILSFIYVLVVLIAGFQFVVGEVARIRHDREWRWLRIYSDVLLLLPLVTGIMGIYFLINGDVMGVSPVVLASSWIPILFVAAFFATPRKETLMLSLFVYGVLAALSPLLLYNFYALAACFLLPLLLFLPVRGGMLWKRCPGWVHSWTLWVLGAFFCLLSYVRMEAVVAEYADKYGLDRTKSGAYQAAVCLKEAEQGDGEACLRAGLYLNHWGGYLNDRPGLSDVFLRSDSAQARRFLQVAKEKGVEEAEEHLQSMDKYGGM